MLRQRNAWFDGTRVPPATRVGRLSRSRQDNAKGKGTYDQPALHDDPASINWCSLPIG
jgi:hypothetical protein